MIKNAFVFHLGAVLLLNTCMSATIVSKEASIPVKKKNLSKQATKEQLGLQKTVSSETIKKSGYSKVNMEQTTLVGTVERSQINYLINEISAELNSAKIKKSAIGTIVTGIRKQNLFVKEFEETYKNHIQGFISSEKKADRISVKLIILRSSFQSKSFLKRMIGENQDPSYLATLCNQRKSEILTEWKTNPFLA